VNDSSHSVNGDNQFQWERANIDTKESKPLNQSTKNWTDYVVDYFGLPLPNLVKTTLKRASGTI